MSSLSVWARATRPRYFTATLVPGVLGAAVAHHQTGTLSWTLLALTLAGLVLAHAGANLANDYCDRQGDVVNPSYSPFNGGSRVIVDGLLRPGQVLRGSLLCYALAVLVGLYLAQLRGGPILVFTITGLLSGFFYVAGPVRLAHRGLGEIFVGINFGPLIVLGSYFVQTQRVSWVPILASLPVGMLITAVLYINEYPDLEADRAVGKDTLVVRWGTERALPGYYLLLAGPYIVVLASILLGLLPAATRWALLTAPLAIVAGLVARSFHRQPQRLLPANALTVGVHVLTGLLLVWGFVAVR